MTKKLMAFCISLIIALSMTQAVYASDIGIKIVGQKDGVVHNPIVMHDIPMFPIGEILKFLDISGTENSVMHVTPLYSFITFQGVCYKITEGLTEVQEYEVDETGACLNATGNVYTLESAAKYSEDYSTGIFVPLSFISDILANSKYGNKFDTHYIEEDKSLEFTKFTVDEAGVKHIESTVNPITLAMKINSSWLLTEDSGNNFDDTDHSVTPIILKGVTLLPIAPIIEKMKGKVTWTGSERKVTITLDKDMIELWIDNKTAYVNGEKKELQVAPSIIKGKTMIPVRFVSENLGAEVLWDAKTQMVVLNYGAVPDDKPDFSLYNYKISLLDATQKQEDNHKTLADVVNEIQQKHDKIQYNDIDPLDYDGKLIHKGDFVSKGSFSGRVKEIKKTKVLVYWDTASFMVDKGKENEMARFYGVTWLADQWIDAKTVTIK